MVNLVQAYGRDLMEAQEWCRKYQRSGNVKDLTQAWDLYYLVFRRISKQLPQVLLQFVQIQNDIENNRSERKLK